MKKAAGVVAVVFLLALFASCVTLVVLSRTDHFGVHGTAPAQSDLPGLVRGLVPVGATDIRYWVHSANVYIRFHADEETFFQWVEAQGFRDRNRSGGWAREVRLIEHPELGLTCLGESVSVADRHFFIDRQPNGGGFTVGYIPESRLVILQASTH